MKVFSMVNGQWGIEEEGREKFQRKIQECLEEARRKFSRTQVDKFSNLFFILLTNFPFLNSVIIHTLLLCQLA